MTEHKYAEILRAIADGKTVQFKSSHLDWTDLNVKCNFSLFFGAQGLEYRVKPKPKVKKWRWILSDTRNLNYLIVSGKHFKDRNEVVIETMNGVFEPFEKIESTMIEVEEEGNV